MRLPSCNEIQTGRDTPRTEVAQALATVWRRLVSSWRDPQGNSTADSAGGWQVSPDEADSDLGSHSALRDQISAEWISPMTRGLDPTTPSDLKEQETRSSSPCQAGILRPGIHTRPLLDSAVSREYGHGAGTCSNLQASYSPQGR